MREYREKGIIVGGCGDFIRCGFAPRGNPGARIAASVELEIGFAFAEAALNGHFLPLSKYFMLDISKHGADLCNHGSPVSCIFPMFIEFIEPFTVDGAGASRRVGLRGDERHIRIGYDYAGAMHTYSSVKADRTE